MGLAVSAASAVTTPAPAASTSIHFELTFDGGVHGNVCACDTTGTHRYGRNRHLHHGRYVFHPVGKTGMAGAVEDVRLAHAGYEVYRNVTSNRAEYLALQGALRALVMVARETGVDLRAITLSIFTDSQLVAQQLRAEWAINDPTLRTLNLRVSTQLQQFSSWHIEWTPRLVINTRLAEVAQPARSYQRPRHKPTLLKPASEQDPSQTDAAQRRAIAHDTKRFKPVSSSVLSAEERVKLQAELERKRLDATTARRTQTRLATKLGVSLAELARATDQADDYLIRIPNTQFSRDELIARFVEIERKRAALPIVAPSNPPIDLPHPHLTHQPAYVAIVRKVDAHLARINSNLSRIALIEHQWKVHCQRQALQQSQPWRNIRQADGSPAFVIGADQPVISQEALLQPGPSVRCFPDMAMAALREARACEFRVWEIARHLDAAGSGELPYAVVRDFLCQTHAVFTVRRFQQIVRKGQGDFWVKHWRRVPDPLTGKLHREAWLRLRGQAEVACLLDLPPLRIHCVRVKLDDLLQGMGQASAALFTAFHAGRGEHEKHNAPISRATLCDLSGRGGSAQRTYDRLMGTTARANYVRTGIPASVAGPNELAYATLRHGGAAFVVNDSVFRRRSETGLSQTSQVSHSIFGHGAIAVRLPNSYRASLTHFERACAGRKRRINQGLHAQHLIERTQSANHLVGIGGRGTNLAVLQRRYFETRPHAQAAWDKRCRLALQHEAQACWAHPDAARELRRIAELLRQPTYTLKRWIGDERPASWGRVGGSFAQGDGNRDGND